MNFNQHLPTYSHQFESETRFLTKTSPHYIFHYFGSSEAEKEIDHIIATQEAGFKKIIEFLDVPAPTKPIEYFFYPTEEIKKALMGDDWYAQAIYNEFRVHVLYTPEIKPIGPHEDTHLLSLPWGLSIGFMQEGLAEYMVGHAWDGTPHAVYVKEGYGKGLYRAIEDFFRHEAWLETDDTKAIYFYSLAGAFSTYLIERFGKERYKIFYTFCNREQDKIAHRTQFSKVFGTTINDFEREFISYIQAV